MAEEPGGNGTETAPRDTSMADQILTHHEDNCLEGIENGALEDTEEESQHHQKISARTMFHQRRNDDDTL
jgi:hypothetical protein